MTSKDWATFWKRAAKRQYHKADRFMTAWIRVTLKLGWKSCWALAWKRAAKKYRTELAEQRGRYDALLAEHKALQELLNVRDETA